MSEGGVKKTPDKPIHHRGKFFTLPSFFQEELEVEPDAEVTVFDCLILPE
jgi:hypothetical protein